MWNLRIHFVCGIHTARTWLDNFLCGIWMLWMNLSSTYGLIMSYILVWGSWRGHTNCGGGGEGSEMRIMATGIFWFKLSVILVLKLLFENDRHFRETSRQVKLPTGNDNSYWYIFVASHLSFLEVKLSYVPVPYTNSKTNAYYVQWYDESCNWNRWRKDLNLS